MTEQPTEYPVPFWTEPKSQVEIDVLLDGTFEAADLNACWKCGARVAHRGPAHTVCYPCERGNRGNWVPHPSVTVRPRAAVFTDAPTGDSKAQHGPLSVQANPWAPMSAEMWQQQAERYATDLATLNARLVRLRGAIAQVRPYLDAKEQAVLDRALDGR